MSEISEKSQNIIKEFLGQWWNDLEVKVSQAASGTELPAILPEVLYDQPFGRRLQEIAAAAEGLTLRNDDQMAEVEFIVQDLCAALWARPGMPSAYQVPHEFWATPLGDLALRAYLWSVEDELISLSRAAEISGRSVNDLAKMAERGRLTAYSDPEPARPLRLRRSQVTSLPKARKKPGWVKD